MESIPGYHLQQHSPLRPLEWRWRRATYLATLGRRLSRGDDDAPTISAARFLAALGNGREQAELERIWPGMQQAETLANQCVPDPRQRWEVEARLLAGEDDASIAARCTLTPASVGWFEALYFNVRDRLAARDWIAIRAIGRGLWDGFTLSDLGGVWRALGYYGGPAALDVIIPLTRDGLFLGGKAEQFTEREPVLAATARRAVLALLVPANAEPRRLAEVHLELLKLERCQTGSAVAWRVLRRVTSKLESLAAVQVDGRVTGERRDAARSDPPSTETQDTTSGAATQSVDDSRSGPRVMNSGARRTGRSGRRPPAMPYRKDDALLSDERAAGGRRRDEGGAA